MDNQDAANVSVVMDNALVHRGATCGNCEVRFLPPYRPFLNLIENAFGVFKLKVRDVLREDETKQRLDEIPPGVSAAEHRIRVLYQVSCTILDDQITISS